MVSYMTNTRIMAYADDVQFLDSDNRAGGSSDSSRSTDLVVPGSIPWEAGWWTITAASPSPWPPLEQGESSTGR